MSYAAINPRSCPKCFNKQVYLIEDLKVCANCFWQKRAIHDPFILTRNQVMSDLLCFTGHMPKETQSLILKEVERHKKRVDPEVATLSTWSYNTWKNPNWIEPVRSYLKWRGEPFLIKKVCSFTLELFLLEIWWQNLAVFQELISSATKDEAIILTFRSLKIRPSEYYSLLIEGREEAGKNIEGHIQRSAVKIKISNQEGMPFKILDNIRSL